MKNKFTKIGAKLVNCDSPLITGLKDKILKLCVLTLRFRIEFVKIKIESE